MSKTGMETIDRTTTQEQIDPTREEIILLRRLRTLQGNDYEAQYFDNKPEPRGDNYKKLGNPSALCVLWRLLSGQAD